MGNREGVGIFVIAAGVLVLIGAAKGTWAKVFNDLFSGAVNTAPGSSGSSSSGAQNSGGGLGSAIGSIGNTIGQGACTSLIPGGALICPILPFSLPYTPPPGTSGSPVAQLQ